MFGLLIGYKTYGLVGISFLAKLVGHIKPEYAPLADQVSAGALSLTPVTIRMAVSAIQAGK